MVIPAAIQALFERLPPTRLSLPLVGAAFALGLSLGATGAAGIAGLARRASESAWQAERQQAVATASVAALAREQAARTAADAALTQLADTQAENARLKEQTAHAITQATTGRTCLAGPALRVLHNAPGIRVELPAAASAAAGADAAPAAAASDTDIALWIAAAGEQYETCRARHAALVSYVQATSQPHQPAPAP